MATIDSKIPEGALAENKKITLSDGKRHFAYDVPGKSVTSYRWAKSE